MQMASKNYVVITFGSYARITLQKHVRITSESNVRLALESYVIKPCKWDQKLMYYLCFEVTSGLRYKKLVRITQ